MPIVVLVGVSHSGKDTAYEYLCKSLTPGPNLKFSGHAKRHFEAMYGLPPYALDFPEYKNQRIPGSSLTYLNLLVNYMKFTQENDPLIYVTPTINEAKTFLTDKGTVYFTDTRSPYEVQGLRHLSEHSGHPIVLYSLTRPQTEAKPSDKYVTRIRDSIKRYAMVVHEICNDGTKEALHQKIRETLI